MALRVSSAASLEMGRPSKWMGNPFKAENGELLIDHTADGIHFDSAAYRTVFDLLRPFLEQQETETV